MKHKNKLLVISIDSVGHFIYPIKYINNINEKVFVAIPQKYYKFVSKLIYNKHVTLINIKDISFLWVIRNKISRIIISPYTDSKNKIFLFIVFFTWNIESALEIPWSRSHNNYIEWIYTIWGTIFTLSKIFKAPTTTNIYWYRANDINAEKIISIFYNKKFKINNLNKNNFEFLKDLHKKEAKLLINLYGKIKERMFPLNLLKQIFSYELMKEVEITFIGVRENEFQLVESLKIAYSSFNIKNLVCKTKLEEMPYLVYNSDLVISIDTSIVHIASILGVRTFTWMDINKPLLSSKACNWAILGAKFWSWKNKDNIEYINSLSSLRNKILLGNDMPTKNEYKKFDKMIVSFLSNLILHN